MKSLTTWRGALFLVLVTGLMTVSELKGAPHLSVQSPTGLYLIAEYKLAVGDTSSGLEFLSRALLDSAPQPVRNTTLNACNMTAGVPTL